MSVLLASTQKQVEEDLVARGLLKAEDLDKIRTRLKTPRSHYSTF